MQILNWLPQHAQQIRYIHPYYEHETDEEGNVVNEWLANEDTCTDVWEDVVLEVKKTKRPIYFRRRTVNMAKDMVSDLSFQILDRNLDKDEWKPESSWGCYPVRVKRLGRRVVFIYDEEYTFMMWNKTKKVSNLKEKKLFKEQPPVGERILNGINRQTYILRR